MSVIRSIEEYKAQKFLKSLASHPYVAIVFENGSPRIYTKEIDFDLERKIAEVLVSMNPDEENYGKDCNEGEGESNQRVIAQDFSRS